MSIKIWRIYKKQLIKCVSKRTQSIRKQCFKNKITKNEKIMQAPMLFHLGNFILVTMEMLSEGAGKAEVNIEELL